MPKITRKMVLWGVIAVVFLAMVVASSLVSDTSTWFVGALVVFSIFIIALAPWVLGS